MKERAPARPGRRLGGRVKKADCELGSACICRKTGWRGSGCIAEQKEKKAAA